MDMKILTLLFFLPVLKGNLIEYEDSPLKGLNDLVDESENIKRVCKDTDILCAFIADASSCDLNLMNEESTSTFTNEVKRRCPLKCNVCPSMYA